MRRWGWCLAGVMLACTACAPDGSPSPPPAPTATGATASATTTAVASVAPTPSSTASAVPPEPKPAPLPFADNGPKPITVERAKQLLFAFAGKPSPKDCDGDDDAATIRCLLEARYADDEEARELVLAMFRDHGTVVGVEKAHRMDGGWRGKIDLVPELPVGRHRRHLTWMAAAYEDFDGFFDGLVEGRTERPAYAFRPLEVRFLRSVKRTTPSAYASKWSVAYNVSGSLHKHATAVRETLFHEIFHLNDRAHERWSEKALSDDFEEILSRCTTKARTLSTPCLTPFAPSDTMVRGGTFYAFQPGNGVWEYAAELAIRYYREHRLVLAGKPLRKKAFKCGPEPNARMWQRMVDEFFGGIDRVPACP